MPAAPRRLAPLGSILLGLPVACLLIGLLLPFIAGERAGLMEDDSYFYAQIAFNSQRFGFFTFDGLSPTSGFHPLWGLLLSAVAHGIGFFSQNKAVHLAIYLTLWFAILLFVSLKVGQTATQRACFFFIGILTAPLMETALLSLLLAVGAAKIMENARGNQTNATLALLGVLIPFTRIDATPIALLWLVPLWAERRQVAIFAAAILAGVLLHFAFLQISFGHPFSVSSILKVGSSLGDFGLFKAVSKVGILARMGVLLGVIAWGGLGLYFQDSEPRRRWLFLFAPPILFSLGHAAVSDMRSWYFLPGYTFAFWAGALSTRRARGGSSPVEPKWRPTAKLSRLWQVVAGVVFALSLYKLYRFVPLAHVRRASWHFVEEATRALPEDGRVYQIDGSGFTGYWLYRHLINGDGLVNTIDYARRMQAGRLAGYFDEQQVCYVITDAPLARRQKFLVNRGGLRIKLDDADEVLRSDAYGWSKNRNAHFILWKLNKEQCNESG